MVLSVEGGSDGLLTVTTRGFGTLSRAKCQIIIRSSTASSLNLGKVVKADSSPLLTIAPIILSFISFLNYKRCGLHKIRSRLLGAFMLLLLPDFFVFLHHNQGNTNPPGASNPCPWSSPFPSFVHLFECFSRMLACCPPVTMMSEHGT